MNELHYMPMVLVIKRESIYELHGSIWLPDGVSLVENGINGLGEVDETILSRRLALELTGEEREGNGSEHHFRLEFPVATRELGLEDYLMVESKKDGKVKKKVALNYASIDDAGDPVDIA